VARKRKGVPLNGWLAIDKPLGLTSTQVIGRVRRLTQANKIGHGGTLDPLATGILPVALGEATKTIPYIMDATKVYHFTVKWGEGRDTDDAEGEVTATSEHRPTPAEVAAALPKFTGDILQKPPLYSAIKVAGQRAYDLARSGEEVELPPRRVHVGRLEIIGNPLENIDFMSFEMVCGKGTYVRSVARDLGAALGTCAYVTALRRLRVGPLDEARSISLDKLEELLHSAPPEELILPVETVLDDIPALAVTGAEAGRLRNGQDICVPSKGEGLVRVMTDDTLVAIGRIEAGRVQPLRIFNLT
jgi:tRNA pseudouridine55 synthase